MNPPSAAVVAPLLAGRERKPASETEDGDLGGLGSSALAYSRRSTA